MTACSSSNRLYLTLQLLNIKLNNIHYYYTFSYPALSINVKQEAIIK